MLREGLIAVLIALTAYGFAQNAVGENQTAVACPDFDVRYGVPSGADLKALIGKPTLIDMQVKTFHDPASGELRLSGFGEAEGVYDVPLQAVLDVLTDYPGQKVYSPRLLDVKVEYQDQHRAVVYQDIGINFFGIKFGSRVRSEIIVDELGPDEVGIRARLLESVDHNLFDSFSSWYLKEVEVDGKEMLYLRNFTSPGLRKPFIGIAGILKIFTPPELKGQIESTVKEALRRIKGS
ncbi:MAG: hypothetical protein ACLQMF_14565 [Rectinemataceae bacterium]